MIEVLISYLSFGAGMYIGMALNNPMSFMKANSASLIRGVLLCFLFWPVGLVAKIVLIMLDKYE